MVKNRLRSFSGNDCRYGEPLQSVSGRSTMIGTPGGVCALENVVLVVMSSATMCPHFSKLFPEYVLGEESIHGDEALYAYVSDSDLDKTMEGSAKSKKDE